MLSSAQFSALSPHQTRQTHALNTTELFLVAMLIVFTLPYLVWRLGRTEYWAPLVVVQIVAGIALGPGVLGAWLPGY